MQAGTNPFGTTLVGGNAGNGVVFRIGTDGKGYSNLHQFAGFPSDGKASHASPLLSGSRLYGSTTDGGTSNLGILFKLDLLLCGDPLSPAGTTASDALFALRAAVGVVTCDSCHCDLNNSESVTASEALRTIERAAGQDVAADCPPCK